MRTLNRRAALAVALGVVTALAAGACNSGEAADPGSTQLRTVSVGYIADFNGASLVAVADQQGLWAKHGLEADLKVFTNGPLQIQAMGAGDLDFGYLGPGALWLPASGQAKVVAVNSIGLADRVIAQPGITSMAQLKGKKVGVPEGTSGDMILRLALAKAGMTIDDVEKVTMDPTTVVTAFGAKQIDAAGIWYPLVENIKARVPDLVELAKSDDFYPATTFPTVFVARNEVAASDRDLVTKMVAVLREANDYRAAHVDEAITTTAALIKAPEDNLKVEAKNVKFLTSAQLDAANADGTANGWFTSINKLFVSFNKLTTATDPTTYYLADIYSGK